MAFLWPLYFIVLNESKWNLAEKEGEGNSYITRLEGNSEIILNEEMLARRNRKNRNERNDDNIAISILIM